MLDGSQNEASESTRCVSNKTPVCLFPRYLSSDKYMLRDWKQLGESPLRCPQSEVRRRQSLCAQRTDPELNLSILAALFPEKSPAAPQTTKGSDDFATDSEDDGAKQNGDVNGEEGGRMDVSRAVGNKRGKVGATLLRAAGGERGAGIPSCRCLSDLFLSENQQKVQSCSE